MNDTTIPRFIIIISLCMGFFLLSLSYAQSTTIKMEHPRIWLTPATKSKLIRDCSPGGSLRNYYLRVKEYVDSHNESTGNNYAYHRYWLSVMLCAMVDGGNYLKEIRDKITSTWGNPPRSRYNEAHQAMIAIAYDWLFEKLTSSEKQAVANHFTDWWDYHNSTSAYFHSSWNNHTMEEVQGFVFGVLALYGDGFCDAQAEQNLSVAHKWLYDEIITATNIAAGINSNLGEDGGWSEGSYYWMRGAYALIESLYAWSSATTDENALDDSLAIKNLGKWIFYITRNDNSYARFSDGYQGTLSLTGQPDGSIILYMLSKLYHDGYARYMWNQRVPPDGILSSSTLSSSYANIYTYYILFNNNTAPIDVNSVHNNIYFDGVDEVILRSSFNSGDTFFFFKNNDWMAGHDHFDAGHFEIARDVGLAIDSGAYEGGDASPNRHDTKYYKRTIAHNTITVYDPNEVWDDYYGRYTTNDGGQKWPGPAKGSGHPQRVADLADDSYNRGGIRKFEDTNGYTYFLSDLTAAYSRADGSDAAITHSSKMELFTREVAYIDSKYFVVFDKVKSSNASFKKRWLLHFVNQPTVTGNLIKAFNGKSVLYNLTIFPQDYQIIIRGGSGKEYWTNYDASGENPTFNTTYYGKPPNEPGAWRAEISPRNQNQVDYFLNVLYAGPRTDTAPVTTSINENNNKMKGVLINGDKQYIILFNTDLSGADISGKISYNIDASSESYHYLFGMPASTKFRCNMNGNTITVEEDPNGLYTSSEKGVLKFSFGTQPVPIIQSITIMR